MSQRSAHVQKKTSTPKKAKPGSLPIPFPTNLGEPMAKLDRGEAGQFLFTRNNRQYKIQVIVAQGVPSLLIGPDPDSKEIKTTAKTRKTAKGYKANGKAH